MLTVLDHSFRQFFISQQIINWDFSHIIQGGKTRESHSKAWVYCTNEIKCFKTFIKQRNEPRTFYALYEQKFNSPFYLSSSPRFRGFQTACNLFLLRAKQCRKRIMQITECFPRGWFTNLNWQCCQINQKRVVKGFDTEIVIGRLYF